MSLLFLSISCRDGAGERRKVRREKKEVKRESRERAEEEQGSAEEEEEAAVWSLFRLSRKNREGTACSKLSALEVLQWSPSPRRH